VPDRAATFPAAGGRRVTRLSATPAALGESPLWDGRRGCLWWIDGVAGLLRRHEPGGEEPAPVALGGHLGSVALTEDHRLLVARDHEILLCDPSNGGIEPVLTLKDADRAMRLNDGKLDRQGRFLCAGMGRGGEPLGALHQLDGAGSHRILASEIRIGNGVCFSPDGGTLYFTDTPAWRIFACDYDPGTGAASEPRLHVDTAPLGSGVDGQTVDHEGNLWSALIHRAEIACFAPDGRLLRRFPAPTDLPSSLAFGGPELTTLSVTSIRDSGTGRAVSKHPDGGHLFAIDETGATGLPEARFSSRGNPA
jgi:sugar lactone lactonase YvrE